MRDIVYTNTIDGFITDNINGVINELVIKELKNKGIGVSDSQKRAFSDSLDRLGLVFSSDVDKSLQCAIEYVVFSSYKKRIDFMISGLDENNTQNILIFELKGWSEETVKLLEYSKNLEANVTGSKKEEVSHPSAQAYGYKKLFENFYINVEQNPINIHTASYLYHYNEFDNCPIKNEIFSNLLIESPTFLKKDSNKLKEFIKRYLKKSDNGEIFESLNGSEIKPTKKLKDNLKNIVLNGEKFSLFEAQEVTFNAIVAKVKWCIENNQKSVFIVKGGPGTGKSIVAIKLLANMINMKDAKAFYVTQNSAVRNLLSDAMQNIDNNEKSGLEQLIKWSGDWVKGDKEENDLDLVVVDEAHRIQTSAQGAKIKGSSIIEEIIKSARVSVFFIDEEQIVTYRDRGTIDLIKKIANKYFIEPIMKDEYNLESQFRCNGSDGYIAFIDYLIKGIKPIRKSYKFEYDFKVIYSGDELYSEIKDKYDQGLYSRFVAGYCYSWDKENPDVKEVYPINLHWNKNTKTWATKNNTFNEVGCIYSAQGVEFDYVGVIIGKDLIYDKDSNSIRIEVENHSKSDHTYMPWNCKKNEENKSKAKMFIINAYKVLLTRGIKGCYVFAEDEELAHYIDKLWEKFKEEYGK